MSFSYDRYDRQQRRTRSVAPQSASLGYWIPIGLTVATVTIGFAAWIWNERNNNDHDDDDGGYYDSLDSFKSQMTTRKPEQRSTEMDSGAAAEPQKEREEVVGAEVQTEQDSIVTRMSGAIRRTPSPQQFFDGASKRMAAGVAAAGAIVGRGLTAIRERDGDYQDHERWSAEAEIRTQTSEASTALVGRELPTDRGKLAKSSGKRKMVAVVVSGAEKSSDWSTGAYEVEHASIVSHLPQDINHENVDVVILIYAPNLQAYPTQLSTLSSSKPPPGSSTTSSYSNISTPVADDDAVVELGTEGLAETNTLYDSTRRAALRLVSHPTHVLPFTTPTGHVHLLRHLCPSLVYMEESLSGLDGEHVREIESWVGQIVIVIGGDGLVDTETEDEGGTGAADKGWWKDSNRVGLGKAEIVDSTRVTEDWAKRIN